MVAHGACRNGERSDNRRVTAAKTLTVAAAMGCGALFAVGSLVAGIALTT